MTTDQAKPTAPVCTKENPDRELQVHPDARCVYDGGWEQGYERYVCPNCGVRFKVELAQ